ncbi:21167_t:CDS:2, partial [Gigaspora margarita]
MTTCTGSDYNAASAIIIFEKISTIPMDKQRGNTNQRLLFYYDQITKKKWEKYIDTTKLDRIWNSFKKDILYTTKKNIPHKKLKKGAPNNLRPNKIDKNSASAILKKDVISLSRIYKSLKYQYKPTKTASLSVNIVADFNHQLANSKEQLKEMLRVAEDFYFLNDIQINTAKSKLLVINLLRVWLSEKGQNMLTKNRAKGVIKFIREKLYKGKAATWFSSIEKKYLTNLSNREIRERLSTHNPNNMLIMPDKADIKEDNRIKNWVLVEEKEN